MKNNTRIFVRICTDDYSVYCKIKVPKLPRRSTLMADAELASKLYTSPIAKAFLKYSEETTKLKLNCHREKCGLGYWTDKYFIKTNWFFGDCVSTIHYDSFKNESNVIISIKRKHISNEMIKEILIKLRPTIAQVCIKAKKTIRDMKHNEKTEEKEFEIFAKNQKL